MMNVYMWHEKDGKQGAKRVFCGVRVMVSILNRNQHVDVEQVEPKEFFDFHSFLDKYYLKLASCEINRTHVFTISCDHGPTILYKKDHNTSEERKDSLLPTKR